MSNLEHTVNTTPEINENVIEFSQAFANGLPKKYKIVLSENGNHTVFVLHGKEWEISTKENSGIPAGKILQEHYEARIQNEIKNYFEEKNAEQIKTETSTATERILSHEEILAILENPKRGDIIPVNGIDYRYTAQSKTPWQQEIKGKKFFDMDYIEGDVFYSQEEMKALFLGKKPKLEAKDKPEIKNKEEKTETETPKNDTPKLTLIEDKTQKKKEPNTNEEVLEWTLIPFKEPDKKPQKEEETYSGGMLIPIENKSEKSDKNAEKTRNPLNGIAWEEIRNGIENQQGKIPEIKDESETDTSQTPEEIMESDFEIAENLDIKATISDMKAALEDLARQEAEENFREQYNKSSWYAKPFYFFRRKGIIKKSQQKALENLKENTTFEQSTAFAERNSRENALHNNTSVNTIQNENIDKFVKEYSVGKISKNELRARIVDIFVDQDMDEFKKIDTVASNLEKQAENLKSYKQTLIQIKDGKISAEEAIKTLKSDVYLSELISKATGLNIHSQSDEVKKYLASPKTLEKLIEQKISVSIDILDTAKGAYQINNSDKETSTYKIGKTLQNHPYLSAIATSGALTGLSALTGGIANILGGGSVVGSISGLRRNADMTDEHRGFEERMVANKQQIKTLQAEIAELENAIDAESDTKEKKKLSKEIKKLSKHLAKLESDEKVFGKNRYENQNFTFSTEEFEKYCKKNKIDDEDLSKIMQEYEEYKNTGKNPHFSPAGFRIVKIEENQDGDRTIFLQRRSIITNATQQHFAPINNLNKKLETYFTKEELSEKDRDYYTKWIAQSLARLDAGLETGHNFLYSASGGEREQDLDALYRNVEAGMKKLGLNLETMRNNPAYIRTIDTFVEDYNFAHKSFMDKRTKTAWKTGIISGGIYGASSVVTQWLTNSGLFQENVASNSTKYTVQNGMATKNTGSLVPNTPTPNASNLTPTSTPQISYEIDTGIADKLKTTLGDTNFETFKDELTKHTTPEEFWSILNDKIFASETMKNQAKNEVMTYILNATDTVNGKEVPELVIEAMKNNVLDTTNFQKTLDRLAKWGYHNVDADWLETSIQALHDGTKTITEFDSKQQTIIAEACFDAVHRDSIIGSESPIWRVFMDSIETVAEPITEVTSDIAETSITETVNPANNSSLFGTLFGSLGIPTWKNTILNWWKENKAEKHSQEETKEEKIEVEEKEKTLKTPETPKNITEITKNKVDKINANFQEISKNALADFSKNQSETTKNITEALGVKPKYTANIDGQNFLLTDHFNTARKDVLAFVKVGDVYEPRLFYFSQSGGNWHSAPGVSDEGMYSKGEYLRMNYEKGTIVDKKIAKILEENLGKNQKNLDLKTLFNAGFTRAEYGHNKLKDAVKVVNIGSPLSLWNITNTHWDISFEELEDMLENFDISSLQNEKGELEMIGEIEALENGQHQFLGETKQEKIILQTQNKNQIEITFAHPISKNKNPELVWIENIALKNYPTSNYGFPEYSLNAGLLTTKPLEYTEQIPDSLLEKSHRGYYGHYLDIRQFFQKNPLIQFYKKQKGI